MKLDKILEKKEKLNKEDIVELLLCETKEDHKKLIKEAYSTKIKYLGKKVFLRGLIEFSNVCEKNCYYCGIRFENKNIHRYNISDNDIIDTIKIAYQKGIMNIVLQSGELTNKNFIDRITNIIRRIKKEINSELRITLCLGEQTYETYKKWYEVGAQRYLLRIETSNESLYKKLHPDDAKHQFKNRLKCLENIKKIGYQTGTGVMIGLPFQTTEDLANDLIFMRDFEIDMVGMGPYIEHKDTPLYSHRNLLLSKNKRFDLTIRMIAILRLMMPYINIAATTALQAINPFGREIGLMAGANVIMPNITPTIFRKNYLLYENKPCIDEDSEYCIDCLNNRIRMIGEEIAYNQFGDSQYYINKKSINQQKK